MDLKTLEIDFQRIFQFTQKKIPPRELSGILLYTIQLNHACCCLIKFKAEPALNHSICAAL